METEYYPPMKKYNYPYIHQTDKELELEITRCFANMQEKLRKRRA